MNAYRKGKVADLESALRAARNRWAIRRRLDADPEVLLESEQIIRKLRGHIAKHTCFADKPCHICGGADAHHHGLLN